MRTPVVAGNWKMNLLTEDSVSLGSGLSEGLSGVSGVEVVVCPVFTSLMPVARALKGSPIALGAQNCYSRETGAFTGELSPQMLLDAGCTWVIIGHSERRRIFEESDALLNEKLLFALESGLKVMFCIGETLDEREGGTMNEVLERQVSSGMAGLSAERFDDVVVAYEPVWAIGTGVTATPEQAQEAHAFVRGQVGSCFSETIARNLRIQYGGSVNAANAAELMSQPDVDGALVGGASLEVGSFSAIVRCAASQQ